MSMHEKSKDAVSETIPDRPNAPRLTPEEIVREAARLKGQKPNPDPDDALSDKRGEG